MRGFADRLGPNAVRVAAIAAIVIAVLLLVLLISSSSSGTYTQKAVFDDVRGLIAGGEVRAGAITIGRIASVELNEADEPEVTMEVEDDFKLHEGATANIRLGSNVGAVNRTVDLTEGDITAPELPEGTTLRGAATDQPVNFDDAVETLDPPTRADIKDLLLGLDAALEGRGRDFDRTLQKSSLATNETASLLADVNADGEALRTLVSEGDRVISALASNPGSLGSAAESTASLLATTAGRQAELGEATQALAPALARGRVTLDRIADATPNLRELVANAGPAVDELGPFARQLPDTTEAAGPFLDQTRVLVARGPTDLRRAEPVIDAATPIASDFPPVIEGAIPLAQDLTAYIPETLGFFQNFGAATGGYDRVGHVVSLASGAAQTLPPSTSGKKIGADECTPGQLEAPYIRLPGTNECQPWRNFKEAFEDLIPKGSR